MTAISSLLPLEALPLQAVPAKATLLERDDTLAPALVELAEKTLKSNPTYKERNKARPQGLQVAIKKFSSSLYEDTRVGRGINDLFLNASCVTVHGQNYILSACPETHQQAADFFYMGLKQDVRVFVSLTGTHELGAEYYNNFWLKERLPTEMREGWKIAHIQSDCVAKAEAPLPNIIKTTFSVEMGVETRTIVHFHFNGWGDGQVAPSERLLLQLLDLIRAENTTQNAHQTRTIQIHCRAGIGRTGVVAVVYAIQSLIFAQMAAGTALDSIVVNPVESTYLFREQRKGIIADPRQMTQLYSLLTRCYEDLKFEAVKQFFPKGQTGNTIAKVVRQYLG
ncbi:MAG TPA: protein-tyrosine phosphatase family protein [Chlamydiales bacterium]|nr:protein-tyrosine phosphatase family protein [Chlamydiales bacterium]